MKTAKQAKFLYVIVSSLFLICGVALIAFPSISATAVCLVTGALSVLYGATKIIGYFSHDTFSLAFQFDLALGIFVTILGALMIFRPSVVISFFPFVIGLFVLIDGVFKLQTSIDARRFGLGEWWLILTGAVVCIALGLFLMLDAKIAADTIIIFTGIALAFDGLQNLFNALYTVKIQKKSRTAEKVDGEKTKRGNTV